MVFNLVTAIASRRARGRLGIFEDGPLQSGHPMPAPILVVAALVRAWSIGDANETAGLLFAHECIGHVMTAWRGQHVVKVASVEDVCSAHAVVALDERAYEIEYADVVDAGSGGVDGRHAFIEQLLSRRKEVIAAHRRPLKNHGAVWRTTRTCVLTFAPTGFAVDAVGTLKSRLVEVVEDPGSVPPAVILDERTDDPRHPADEQASASGGDIVEDAHIFKTSLAALDVHAAATIPGPVVADKRLGNRQVAARIGDAGTVRACSVVDDGAAEDCDPPAFYKEPASAV